MTAASETIAVDLFAGFGGFTEAAEQAGAKVVCAANHNRTAVKVHRANHPNVLHLCQDLRQTNWVDIPRMDLLLASPACQGYSRAASRGGDGTRGSAPKHDADRQTALAVLACLECHLPPVAIVENVKEFTRWKLFRSWMVGVSDLGYSVAPHYLDSADFGAPQFRKRVFLVLTRSKAPLFLMFPKTQHVPIRSVLDLDLEEGWAPVSSKSPGVGERVAAARARKFPRGIFITQHTTGHRGRSLDRPLGTVTTHRHWCLVREGADGDEIRDLTVPELLAAQGFRRDYKTSGVPTADVRMVGNAVNPFVAKPLIERVLASA